MRLVSFLYKEKVPMPTWGIWEPEKGYVFDICQAEPSLPATLRQAVTMGDDLFPILQQAVQEHGDNEKLHIPLNTCILQAPYTDPPRNILCTGINYVEHLHELQRPMSVEQTLPTHPFVFTKPCTAIAHPDATITSHSALTDKYDYEVELAVIIGKEGVNITEENALEHVFGYSILNDLSARDLQRRTSQWYGGKSLDASAPFGPCIVCRQCIDDPQNLHLESRINGEVRQSANTSNMIFTVAKLIHLISQGSTLLPGDIIATGTPSGVGMSFKPGKFLRAGDVMELTIDHIGTLRNTMGA